MELHCNGQHCTYKFVLIFLDQKGALVKRIHYYGPPLYTGFGIQWGHRLRIQTLPVGPQYLEQKCLSLPSRISIKLIVCLLN